MLSCRRKQEDQLVSHVFLTETSLAVMSYPPGVAPQPHQQQVGHPVERAVVALLLGALLILFLTVSILAIAINLSNFEYSVLKNFLFSYLERPHIVRLSPTPTKPKLELSWY